MGNSTLPLGGGDASRLSEIILQPGHAFVAGDVVRADETTPGEYVLAQADTAANAEAVGIVETVAGDSFELVYQGRVDLSGAAWADLPFVLPADQVWFLSATVAGELTRIPPSTAGSVIKAMLVVTDDTALSESGLLTGYIGVQIGGENLVDLNDIQPLGTIQPWAAPSGSPIPNGWALCDGQAISRTTFSDLFTLITTTYGVGDGSTTFNVPDLRGRAGIGLDGVTAGVLTSDNNAGDSGGEERHILSLAEAPQHRHTHTSLSNAITNLAASTHNPLIQFTNLPGAIGATNNVEGSNEGGGGDHNNMQPFLVINFLIRVTAQSSAALLDHGLSDHSDVGDVSAPNDCDLLKFNAGTGEWEAAPGGAPAGAAVFSFRNKVINGRFDIWQRGPGTFDEVALPIGGKYTADRWVFGGSDGGGVRTSAIDQGVFLLGQTDVPGFPRRFMQYQNVSAGVLDGSENSVLIQRIEDVRTFNGGDVTVSFWAKSDVAPAGGQENITVHFRQFFGGGGGSAANIIAGQEITLTTTWTYYTLTFALPNIGGSTLGSFGNDSLRLRFVTQAGAGAAAAQNLPGPVNFVEVLHLANVQVEEGADATAFEVREIETEVALCQRYYSKAHDIDTAPFNMGAVPGVQDASQNNTPGIFETHADINSGGNATTMLFPVRMRSAPSLEVVQVAPSVGPTAVQTLTANFIGESSVSWRSQNTLVAFLWTADSEI